MRLRPLLLSIRSVSRFTTPSWNRFKPIAIMATESAQPALEVNMADAPAVIPDVASTTTATTCKRKAETDVDDRVAKKSTPSADSVNNDETSTPNEIAESEIPTAATSETPAAGEDGKPLMSKSQLKKLRKQQAFEAQREHRKVKRKEKRHEKQAKKREEKAAKIAEAEAAGLDPAEVLKAAPPLVTEEVPISIVIDCDFEQYMRDHEIISLSSQIVRSYAMNRKARYNCRLYISGFKGKLKNHFETRLKNTHLNWKNVAITEDSFVESGKQAREYMRKTFVPNGATQPDPIVPAIAPVEHGNIKHISLDKYLKQHEKYVPEDEDVNDTIVYLTSDSEYTLERLDAGTTYVIGGIVDRNREKNLCYNRAKEYKVRHAKLPIGQYMAMRSRFVLTTNQVVEIMVKWLEYGDWGKAFMEVIPSRKGGKLLEGQDKPAREVDDEDDDDDDSAELIVIGGKDTDLDDETDKNGEVTTAAQAAAPATEMD
ncbi:guanine-1-methyltransferase-domain-containing protein [Podospora australis]|uniref:tRNA (guanine(9)-N1)-methyltransferase n=1 Tax=Podospora australis TaxID=1536484 RepID=A0AAN6X1E5_9PEZI|nr:guanine-1-methyltransferase-domain-containing protein [Podospora australis]